MEVIRTAFEGVVIIDPYGFEKDGPFAVQTEIFVTRDAYRQHARHHQDDDERVAEFFQELFP